MRVSFEFTLNDAFGSRIAKKNVWFVQGFDTHQERNKVAGELATKHRSWKIQAAITYKRACVIWVGDRMDWEWRLVAEVWNHHRNSVQWPVQMSIKIYKAAGPPTEEGFEDVHGDDAVKMVEDLKIIRGETKVSPAKGLRALLKGAGIVDSDSEDEEQDPDEDMDDPEVDPGEPMEVVEDEAEDDSNDLME